jgi:cytochrome c oxidase subunit 4
MLRVIALRSNKSLVRLTLNNSSVNKTPVAFAHAASAPATTSSDPLAVQAELYPRVGRREIVGYGRNGEPQYFDAPDCPNPGIRWVADTAELTALRLKAQGDWSKLTIEEKKTLYRADYRATIVETVKAGQGTWKFVVGSVLGLIGGSIWLYFGLTKLIYDYPRKETSSLEHQNRMLERMIAQGQGKVHGVSAGWDYEKGDWKSAK